MYPQLTARQREVLDFLVEYIVEHEYPPTIREICDKFGFRSTNAAFDHLKSLEYKGWIYRTGLASRGISLSSSTKLEYAVDVPAQIAMNQKRALRRVVKLVKDLPEDVLDSIQKCTTPMQGAMVVLDTVRGELEEELGRITK